MIEIKARNFISYLLIVTSICKYIAHYLCHVNAQTRFRIQMPYHSMMLSIMKYSHQMLKHAYHGYYRAYIGSQLLIFGPSRLLICSIMWSKPYCLDEFYFWALRRLIYYRQRLMKSSASCRSVIGQIWNEAQATIIRPRYIRLYWPDTWGIKNSKSIILTLLSHQRWPRE